jgi:chromosomal replication initiator protein
MPPTDGRGPDAPTESKLTWARFVPLPENRSARAAVQALVDGFASNSHAPPFSLLMLHGPPGVGKTHLVWALVDLLGRTAPGKTARVIAAGDLDAPEASEADAAEVRAALLDADLLVIDDLHRLPERACEGVVQILDRRASRGGPTVVVAADGPARLDPLSARLVNRLAGGLVVGLESPGPASRLALLTDKVKRRRLKVLPDVLAWLAERLTGARQLDGALTQLELLSRLQSRPIDLTAAVRHFQDAADADRPTVERIVGRVGGYFQVDPRQLQSARRHRNVVLPRQVGMYLARQLTTLSLGDIGAYFGGRDHTTVLHACRKVEDALTHDTALSGAVRQLRADLT